MKKLEKVKLLRPLHSIQWSHIGRNVVVYMEGLAGTDQPEHLRDTSLCLNTGDSISMRCSPKQVMAGGSDCPN